MKFQLIRPLSEFPAMCKEGGPITFMLINLGNGFTHHVIRDGQEFLVEGAGKYNELREYQVKTNPVHARVPFSILLALFPKAFFVPFHDLAIVEPLYFPGTPFCIGSKLCNHF